MKTTLAATARPMSVVVGDIGGHPRVLEDVLHHLGVDEDGRLPDGLTVVQVGDLVRATAGFRDGNTQVVRRMSSVLAANAPDRWVQLTGNHECALLGGASRESWDPAQAFEPECVSVVSQWWRNDRMLLAYAHEGSLVTHAGLTRARWHELGAPQSAADVADLINQTVGADLAEASLPGSLVSGRVVLNADTMWAEVNHEFLLPWLLHDDMPFDQVHGHAAPFHWPSGDWWPGTPALVQAATDPDVHLRRSTTRFPTGHKATSVDWTLEDEVPEHIWPLFCLTEESPLPTHSQAPASSFS